MNCVICGIRKPRRACPGVKGDICTICCGTEREQTVDCPLDCEFLRHAHEHEKTPEIEDKDLTDRGITVDEDFLRQYEWVLMLVGSAIIDAYRETPAITDFDIRDAMESMVRTFQTLESGLVYETKPTNPYAAAICDSINQRLAAIQRRLTDAGETAYLSDGALLKLMVFVRRLELLENNGRKRSRSFLDMLSRSYVPAPDAETEAPAEAPQVIL